MSRKVIWSFSFLILLGMSVLALLSPLMSPSAQMAPLPVVAVSSTLSLDDREACQTAVAQVYWDATIWPDVNPQPKPALADVLSARQIEAQTVDSLAQSVALESIWQLPITGEMLQAEMERMAAYSQSPEQLRALFAALGNDPMKIAECLARPQLVERLIRQQMGYDAHLHAETRQQATTALAGVTTVAQLTSLTNANTLTWVQGDPTVKTTSETIILESATFADRLQELHQIFNLDTDETLTLNQISPLQEDETRFYVLAVIEQSQERLQVVYAEWPKQAWTSWWQENKGQFDVATFRQPEYAYTLPAIASAAAHNPQNDSWQYMPAMPWNTGDSRSVWTGSVMLVWGGAYTTNGYRYDPVLDDWRPITTVDAPHARHSFTAVWTGTEMIVYGGCNGGSEFCTDGSGGRYNPTTDTWTDIAGGSARRQHVAVWSGTEMLVWGGCRENANGNQNCNILVTQGARYNPASNSWMNMTLTNAPGGMRNARAVWANDQMILWNGTSGANGRYFPATDSWQPISLTDAPPALVPSLVWTGTGMIAWGGCTTATSGMCTIMHNTGGRYNPTTDTWTATSLTNAPAPRLSHTAVWTGNEMMIWGGDNGSNTFFADGGRYNPVTDSWTVIGTTSAPSARGTHHAHWTGQIMLVWGGFGFGDERTGGRYNPATDSWTPTTTNDPYRQAVYHASVWNGTHMISWGGEGEQFIDPFYQRARLYDPATDTWSMSSRNHDLSYFWWPTAVWTGTEMIIWGGQYGSSIFNHGTRYNPLTDSWTPTSLTNAPEGRGNHTGVWTGTELIVWGGSTLDELGVQTGGRYNPATDSWQVTSLTNAPSGRNMHQAVWTGNEMVVWGGRVATGYANDGGRYDPLTNTWTAMSLANAPSARIMFATVWTGEEMIVWGGGVYVSNWTYYNTGGRYNPATDTWMPTSLTNAPEGRARFASVWTGEEMVAWGGCHEHNCLTDVATGGRYNPATDSWMATSTTHVIEGREFHTMVWTGNEVIVWGGQTDQNGYSHIGGRYLVPSSGNSAPQANTDSYSLVQDTTITVTVPGVLLNDFDVDNDPLTATLVITPSAGTLTFEPDGSFVYTPEAGYIGLVSFRYRVSDGMAQSNIAQVSLQVLAAPNQLPVATNDAYTTPFATTLTVSAPGVLVNDHDPDGQSLQAVWLTSPAHGQLTLSTDGNLVYVPDAGYSGVDSFTYRAYDGFDFSNEATVTITVEPGQVTSQVYLPFIVQP
jgi:N-acetylneuraminic acid mutarotase